MTAPTVPQTETHKIKGEQLVARVKELVHAGNVRRIIVKNDKNLTIMEVPFTIGVVGAVLAPVWVALGAIAALAAHYTVEVEKRDESDTHPAM
jgi:hypothetical protein